MKKLTLFLAALLGVVTVQAAPQADLIARIHFLGGGKISADANAAAFTNEFCSAEAGALESQTLDKLSRAPGAWFKSKIPAGAGDGSAQLRPLLDDLLKSEWIFEMRDAADGSPEYALAIRLDNSRAQLWDKNLQTLLQNWTGMGISQDKNGIWELKKHLPPNSFQFNRWNDWVIIDCGQNELSLQKRFVEEFSRPVFASPMENWLDADLDWPRLAQFFPALAKFDFPKIQMHVVGRDGNLRLNGKLVLSQPLQSLPNWRFPTNIIHQPIVSLTAVRGFAPWLGKQNWAQPFEISPVPDQVFIWALAQVPFQTFAAVPVADAKQSLAQLGRKLSADTGWQNHFMLPPTLTLTGDAISWTGLPPFVAPEVRALHGAAGDFLCAGLFPNPSRGRALPPELMAQLAAPNLVYYHWEMTAQRLNELPQLTQLSLMLTQHRQLDAQSAAGKWLDNFGKSLGDTVTTVTQTAPDELTFTRKSPGGLTAMELVALANWLEAPDFPGCNLSLPPPPKFKHPHPHPQTPAAPASQPFLLH